MPNEGKHAEVVQRARELNARVDDIQRQLCRNLIVIVGATVTLGTAVLVKDVASPTLEHVRLLLSQGSTAPTSTQKPEIRNSEAARENVDSTFLESMAHNAQ